MSSKWVTSIGAIGSWVFVGFLACAPLGSASRGVRVGRLTSKFELPPKERIELGKTLFFDERLSSTGRMSCGTCHDPKLGFGDGKKLAVGSQGQLLRRHAPSLFNLALGDSFFWDGRAESLEEQVLEVIENPDEFNTTLDEIVAKLERDAGYVEAFEQAFSSGLRGRNVLRALADFQRSLLAFDSPFDRFLDGDEMAMEPAAQRGFVLFRGKAGCVQCHSGPNFTDDDFHNTGVPTTDRGRIEVERNVRFQMRPYPFLGRHKAFKTPTLRNVALSPPYFHNGSAATLEEVVNFYRAGGTARDTYGRSPDVQPLDLTTLDVEDLVAFLEALTSESAAKNEGVDGESLGTRPGR